jgi:hypothetical protein
MFDHMSRRIKPFNRISPDKLYGVDIFFCAGPVIDILAYRRESLNNKDIEEANKFNTNIGVPPFKTVDQLEKARGAGRALLRLAHARTWANILRRRQSKEDIGESTYEQIPAYIREVIERTSYKNYPPANIDDFGKDILQQCYRLAPFFPLSAMWLFWSWAFHMGEAWLHHTNLKQIQANDGTVLHINPKTFLQQRNQTHE